MIRYSTFDSPLGTLIAVAAGGALNGLYFDDQRYLPSLPADAREDRAAPLLARCRRQLDEYFRGERRAFDLPLAPEGTGFQRRVWTEIARIPFGKTITYAELAKRAGAPGSARAAGSATGRNPLGIIVPCHRVVGSDGSLTGYAGGIPRKTRLLEIEGVAVQSCPRGVPAGSLV
jgi:methylated-DNA-[protein]-cysteine S-methyltransferase